MRPEPLPADEPAFWQPEPLFAGQTVFVLGSGPSLTAGQAERVRCRACIAVNATCPALAPWAPVWFFTDTRFFEQFRPEIAAYVDRGGLGVTLSPAAVAAIPALRRPETERCDGFPRWPRIRQGRCSGGTGVALAVGLGGVRIVLLGFDMRVVGGREHCHDAYAGQLGPYGKPRDLEIYAKEFAPGFAGWHADARAVGVEIVNATPGSALAEFPMVDLEDELC